MRITIVALVLIAFTGLAVAADVADLEKKVADAKAGVETARASAIAKLESTAGYKAAVADAAAKLKALEDARANGTPADRIAASSAYNKARGIVEKMKADAMKSDVGVQRAVDMARAAEKELASAKETAEKELASAKEKERNSPMRVAIRKHQILKGMTEAQIKEAMTLPQKKGSRAIWQSSRDTATMDTGETIYVYSIGYSLPEQGFTVTRTIRIVVKEGVVVSFSQTRVDSLDFEPESE